MRKHHLIAKGRAALALDGIGYGHPTNELLHQALVTPAGWDAFVHAVYTDADLISAHKWVAHWDKRMRVQTQRREGLPPVYGNGAIEAPIARVRAVLESRRWTFRNRARMDLLLELVRMADLRADDADVYAADIRQHLTNHGGRPPRSYRAIYDTWGPKGNENRNYSLWASPAEKAARDLRGAERRRTGRPPLRADAQSEGNTTTVTPR